MAQDRIEREAWQLDHCPLLKPHDLSAAPVVSPCVQLEAVGGTFAAAAADLDDAVHGDTWTSAVKYRNGLNPVWLEKVEVGVSDPDLAVLRITVWDRPTAGLSTANKFLGYATIPVSALRMGYRSVPLRDRNGCSIAFSALLCHFRVSNTHLPPSIAALSAAEKLSEVAKRGSLAKEGGFDVPMQGRGLGRRRSSASTRHLRANPKTSVVAANQAGLVA